MANISFNPSLMTGAQNAFLLDTQGFVAGLTQDDYNSRGWLESGIVAAAVSQPVWGGLGVLVDVATEATNNRQGPSIALASTTVINGFTVFDQGINYIQTPGNTVPTVVAGQNVPFYRFGTNAPIALKCSSAAATAIAGATIAPTLYWDTVAFQIVTTSNANTVELPAGVTVRAVNFANSKVANYASGVVSWVNGQPAVVIIL